MWWHTVTHGKGSEGEKYRMQMVASTLHTTAEHAVSNTTTADVHVSAASSRLNLRPPADFNVVVLLATKTKSVFCACAIIFETHSTACSRLELRRGSQHMCTAVCRQLVRCVSGPADTEFEGTIFFWMWRIQDCSPSDRHSVTLQVTTIATCQWRTEGFGVFKFLRNSEGQIKSCQTQPDFWKMPLIAEFKTQTHQDVRKKCTKI